MEVKVHPRPGDGGDRLRHGDQHRRGHLEEQAQGEFNGVVVCC